MQLSKGLGANLDEDIKRKKIRILEDIKWLDDTTENGGLDDEGWRLRYNLERELEEVYTYEESIWQKDVVRNGFYRGCQYRFFPQYGQWKEEIFHSITGN
jgi:hypothetical protein